jgi:hypothetical protein
MEDYSGRCPIVYRNDPIVDEHCEYILYGIFFLRMFVEQTVNYIAWFYWLFKYAFDFITTGNAVLFIRMRVPQESIFGTMIYQHIFYVCLTLILISVITKRPKIITKVKAKHWGAIALCFYLFVIILVVYLVYHKYWF